MMRSRLLPCVSMLLARGSAGTDPSAACLSRSRRNHLCITFELLSINLYEFIKNNNFQGLSLGLIRRFAIQVRHSLHVSILDAQSIRLVQGLVSSDIPRVHCMDTSSQ